MVRAGVVSHPSKWPFGGYDEIQKPRRKYMLIAHQKLVDLSGFESYDVFRKAHKELVDESLSDCSNSRQAAWSESVAVGSQDFVETIKGKLGIRAKGRKVLEKEGKYQLREEVQTYNSNSDRENGNIGRGNTYAWSVNDEYSVG